MPPDGCSFLHRQGQPRTPAVSRHRAQLQCCMLSPSCCSKKQRLFHPGQRGAAPQCHPLRSSRVQYRFALWLFRTMNLNADFLFLWVMLSLWMRSSTGQNHTRRVSSSSSPMAFLSHPLPLLTITVCDKRRHSPALAAPRHVCTGQGAGFVTATHSIKPVCSGPDSQLPKSNSNYLLTDILLILHPPFQFLHNLSHVRGWDLYAWAVVGQMDLTALPYSFTKKWQDNKWRSC